MLMPIYRELVRYIDPEDFSRLKTFKDWLYGAVRDPDA